MLLLSDGQATESVPPMRTMEKDLDTDSRKTSTTKM